MAIARRSGTANALREVEALARVHTNMAVKVLADICLDVDAPAAARVSSAAILLDRGWGKATQPIVLADASTRMDDSVLQQKIIAKLKFLSLPFQEATDAEESYFMGDPNEDEFNTIEGSLSEAAD
jgi:hypothetical protein